MNTPLNDALLRAMIDDGIIANTPESSAAQGAMGDEGKPVPIYQIEQRDALAPTWVDCDKQLYDEYPAYRRRVVYFTKNRQDIDHDVARRAFENIRNNYVGWQGNENFAILELALQSIPRNVSQPSDATAQPIDLTDERAWQIAVDVFGTTLRDTRHPAHVEIPNAKAAGEYVRALLANMAKPASLTGAQIEKLAEDFWEYASADDLHMTFNAIGFAHALLANKAQGKPDEYVAVGQIRTDIERHRAIWWDNGSLAHETVLYALSAKKG